MPRLRFVKYHGLQNDFIVVDGTPRRMTAQAAARLCHRRRGIGADGVLSLMPPTTPGAAFTMHVYNADGSEAEMCGNGLRCVVRHYFDAHGVDEVLVDTGAGPRSGVRVGEDIRVTLGTATLVDPAVDVPGRPAGTGISMGNPHLVLSTLVDEAPLAAARAEGPALERHPRFPNRVNVSFPRVIGPQEIDLVVFERGSGITDACGTGAAACATTLARRGEVSAAQPITVHLPGGPLKVWLQGDPTADVEPGAVLATVEIEAEAVRIFEGTIALADDELE